MHQALHQKLELYIHSYLLLWVSKLRLPRSELNHNTARPAERGSRGIVPLIRKPSRTGAVIYSMKVGPGTLLLGVVTAQQRGSWKKAKGNPLISLPKINQNVRRARGRERWLRAYSEVQQMMEIMTKIHVNGSILFSEIAIVKLVGKASHRRAMSSAVIWGPGKAPSFCLSPWALISSPAHQGLGPSYAVARFKWD